MKCLKIFIVATVRILEDFFGLKLEMETENDEKDVKKRYKMKIRLSK